MSPLPTLVRASLRRPPLWVAGAVFLALSGLAAAPILRQPGYELATVLGLALAFLGALPARAVVESARRMPQPPGFAPLAGATLLLTLALPVPAVLTAIVASLATTPCNPLAGLPFVLVIVPSSAVICAAVGLLCALARQRFRGFIGLYLLAVLASAVVTAWPVVAGPQVFAFNDFAGYFPGPLYDESLHLTSALLWARLEALLVAGAALSATHAGMSGARASRWAAAAMLVAVFGLRLAASQLGLETSAADLDDALGGVRTTAHFRIHHPRERSARDVEQLARELELRYAQDSAFLGVNPPGLIDAYFYRSPQEKQRWVGAAETDFAKPWLHQFHVQFVGFPDPVVKHELADVLAGELGSGPFRVCAWAGLIPNPAIIEGLATAADDRADELTLAEWSHAMRVLHLAPDLRQLLKPTGFFAASAARGYTLSGAFLRHLHETYGKEKLAVLYRHGDFDAAYGKSLDALVTEWEHANDQVPLDAHARTVAEHRFAAPSLFGRTCAREEARLRESLGEIPAAEPTRAVELTRRLLKIAPDDLDLLHELAVRLRDGGDRDGERKVLKELLAHAGVSASQQASARDLLGALAAESGQLDEARAQFQAVLALQPESSSVRSAEIHLASLDAPSTLHGVLAYFAHPGREDALLGLRELADDAPQFAPARYLIGRRLTDAQLPVHALAYLDHPEQLAALRATHDEALSLRARDHAVSHQCAAIADDQAALLDPTPATRQRFSGWTERCNFEIAQGWPVLPEP